MANATPALGQTEAQGVDPIDLGNGITGRIMIVTPELAERWLGKNAKHNRTIGQRHVEGMASDMREGNWRLTHQGICFDSEGRLIDGQHRLSAVVLSGAHVKMLVFANDHGSLTDPIDTNRTRSIGFLIGQKTNFVAASNVLRFLEAGSPIWGNQTTAESATVIEHHQEHLIELTLLPKCSAMAGSVLGALAYARPIDPPAIDRLAVQIKVGEMIRSGDPAFAFRLWLGTPKGRAASSWDRALAALSVCRYAIQGVPMRFIHIAEEGYRAITTRRRALKIPHTPGTNLTPTATWDASK
jgi:hypothetical protein